MKHLFPRGIAPLLLTLLLGVTSCHQRDDEPTPVPPPAPQPEKPTNQGPITGFFLLNEANMGSQASSLDYFDYETQEYTKDILSVCNPGKDPRLGDVGNDIQIYGDKVYAVINLANAIEVFDLHTGRTIKRVYIPNCRYVAFKDGYAYVTSYSHSSFSFDGYVAKVDTASLQVRDICYVGSYPDELVVLGNKLYTANSGGLRDSGYDNTVSVVNLDTFTEEKRIEVAINLHRLEVDNQGMIWVSSRGDYEKISSKLFVLDPKTEKVTKTIDVPCTEMTISGDSLFYYGVAYNKSGGSWTHSVNYGIINTKTQEVITTNFIKDGTESEIVIPYGIAVDRENNRIYVTDAKNYVSEGLLFCYDLKTGTKIWSKPAGNIPAHIAFTRTKLHRPITNNQKP